MFLAEATANLFTLPLITHTRATLSFLLINPRQIKPAAILFARSFTVLIIGGLTTGLLVGATNTRNGIESRRPVYFLLGLGEALLIPLLALEIVKGGARDAALSPKMAVAGIATLLPGLIWRLYVLCVRPESLGRYAEEGEERRPGGGTKGE